MTPTKTRSRTIKSSRAARTRSGVKEAEQTGSKIDFLSSLPNELLDKIFEDAWTIDQPLTGFLSIRLLPWDIKIRYRRISIAKARNLRRFVARLKVAPQLGAIVQVFQVKSSVRLDDYDEASTKEPLEGLFRNLPSVEELDLDQPELTAAFYRCIKSEQDSNRTSLFPALRSLRVDGGGPRSAPEVKIQLFTSLESLISLDFKGFTLHRTRWNEPGPIIQTSSYTLHGPPIPNLKHLSIEGQDVDAWCIGHLCSRCPNLTSLRLDGDMTTYGDVLPDVPDCLEELELLTRSRNFQEYCDHELPRFTRLKRLTLGSAIFSDNLPDHIANLSHLERLELGEGTVPISRLNSLIKGPTRLPSLRTLIHKCKEEEPQPEEEEETRNFALLLLLIATKLENRSKFVMRKWRGI
ncbi:uncharacterized protein JCM6883_006601 [Sporobolomyces salmoneus]|uniref:uncharacterized protein n=1 Tax=Sporobolomyces salmoneus TaxID=183962 RepID=UPI00318185F5